MNQSLPIMIKLKAELEALQRELAVEIPHELEQARAHGDISENAEFAAAKEHQGIVRARIAQLAERLHNLSRYNVSSVPTGMVGYGSRVELEDTESGEIRCYELVFPEEADPARGSISLSSPMGQALLNRETGDEVSVRTPAGQKTFGIISLTTIHERRNKPKRGDHDGSSG